MDFDQIQKELRHIAHADKLKPNPHKYLIVDKWNYKYVYYPHKHEIFKFVEENIDKYVEELVTKKLKTFVDKDII